MIIYSKTKEAFLNDLDNGVLEGELEVIIEKKLGRHTPPSEIRAWSNSLTRMGLLLSNSGVPCDAGIAVEYNIPYTSKRVDFIVSGLDAEGRNSAVVIELKQWEKVESVPGKDGVVRTFINGGDHEMTHPSYQVWSYVTAISDFNAEVQDRNIVLQPCAYLHNYILKQNDPLIDPMYSNYTGLAPVFTKQDGGRLKDLISDRVRKGDGLRTISLIDGGRLRPSKSLQDAVASMMEGNREFTMIDAQKVVFEEVLYTSRLVAKGGKKRTIIIKGGPGTGKSVVAMNLLVSIVNDGQSAVYVSKNQAPRYVYAAKLKGSMKMSRIDMLFRGSGGFTEAGSDVYDVLLVDEAHRLNEKSGLYSNLGENQVKEIINASRLSVFFIDEEQRVTLKDIGTVDGIKGYAREFGSEVTELELDSQFRCFGSDGYMQWLDNALQVRETANLEFDDDGFEYDFRVFDDPCEMRAEIECLNKADNRSRIVAGYCWNWISGGKNDPSIHDIVIPEHGFEMSWNLGDTNTWAIDPGSVKEAGCIHTCQGLEFDYVGVIVGPDIRYEGGQVVTDYTKRAKTDQSLKGLKSKYKDEDERRAVADRIIKDTYRVLMSRGMKGCFVYCTDKGMAEHLRTMSDRSRRL